MPDPSTLVVFRRRLGEEGFRRLFDRLVEDLRAKGLIKGKWVLVDGTKLTAHAAAKNTLTLMREDRARLLKALAQKSPEEAKKLSRYAEPLPDREYSSQAELLAAEKEVGRELAAALKPHKEDPALKELLAMLTHLNKAKASHSEMTATKRRPCWTPKRSFWYWR